ncbi:hypothetical protein DQG13_09340 [Paenibacillus sp. YN15]|nr:hypothetical protein DQG13_09340 [Paenibacillus sp. YN15]
MTGYRTADGSYIFNPDAPALREDITVAITKLKGFDVSRLSNRSIIEAMFKDYDGISEAAKDYVAVAVENGLVSGYEDETFRPQATVTRAEAATLLWRAFQYGSDNKGVGGATTTTPSASQPTPTVSPKSTLQPSATPKPANAKFSVDTLVGGTGAEDIDGPVSMAQISRLDSVALDKDDNIYFLNAEKNKVRKFNAGNGTVETLSIADHSLDNRYSLNQPHTYFQSLTYNPVSNKLYLGATIAGTHYITFYEIRPTVQSVTYAPANGTYYSFVQFTDDNNLFLGYNSYYDDSIISQATLGKEASVIAKASDKTGFSFGPFSYYSWQHIDAIVNANTIYVFDTYISTITKL